MATAYAFSFSFSQRSYSPIIGVDFEFFHHSAHVKISSNTYEICIVEVCVGLQSANQQVLNHEIFLCIMNIVGEL